MLLRRNICWAPEVSAPWELSTLPWRPSADTSGPRRAALTLTAARSALSFRSELAATAEQLEHAIFPLAETPSTPTEKRT